MAQLIEVPGLGQVEFPDGMSDEAIAQAIQKNLPAEPREGGFLGGVKEAAKVAGSAVYGGLTAIPRAVMDAGDALEEKFPTPSWSHIPIPGQAEIASADKAVRDAIKPDTPVGQSLARVGETGIATALGPGMLTAPLKAAAIGLGAGIGGELGHQLDPSNPLLEMGGALIGGGVPALVSSHVPNSTKLLQTATKFTKPKDFNSAAATKATLDKEGISSLASQHLGDSSTLADLMEIVAAHPKTRGQILDAVRGSELQAQKAVERWSLGNLPPRSGAAKETLRDAQEVASGKLSDLKNQANKAYTDALPSDIAASLAPTERVQEVIDNLRKAAADPNFGGRTSGAAPLLKAKAKQLEDLLNSDAPVAFGELEGINKWLKIPETAEGLGTVGKAQVKSIVKAATPEYDPARKAKEAFMRSDVEPFERGLAGELAQMGGGLRGDKQTARESIINTFFPKTTAQAPAIRRAAQDLGSDVIGDVLKLHLSRELEGSVKLAGSAAEAVKQPYDFVRAVAGTRAQRTNLRAAITVVAKGQGQNPDAVYHGFTKLMRALATTKDLKIPDRVNSGTLEQLAGANIPGFVVAPNSRIGRWTWEKASAKAYQQIADIVLSPDALKQLSRIGRKTGFSEARSLARGVLLSSMLADEPLQQVE